MEKTCSLCSLPLSSQTIFLDAPDGRLPFCCKGCLQVFVMLSGSEQASEGRPFQETELFQKCQALGIIPRRSGTAKSHGVGGDGTGHRIPGFEKEKIYGSPAPVMEGGLVFDLRISGMWCPACAWVIEEAVRKDPGVQEVFCHFSTDRFRCRYDPVTTSPKKIVSCIQDLGYGVRFPDDSHHEKDHQAQWVKMIVSVFLTMNVMMFSFALYVGFFDAFPPDTLPKLAVPVFLMTAGVLLYGGKDIFFKAVSGIRNAAFGMETLIAVGTFVAFAFSTYNLAKGSLHLYFDTAAMLITLVLIGKHLESRAKNRVQADLDHFFSLVPNKVRLCTDADPAGRYVAAQALKAGDRFRVEAGEVVAADGVILEGVGNVDESALTGEARPVRKARPDRLRGGSRILRGSFRVQAEAVGRDSLFGQMLTLMEEALAQKGPHEARAERILRWMVPGIFLLSAGVVFLVLVFGHSIEEAVVRGITVIVVTCPCALGFAIPLARTAGASLMLKHGILLKDFSALEHADRVQTVVFDKTGTLTKGRWRLQEQRSLNRFDPETALSLAAALEKDAAHYIAAEILGHAKKKGINPFTLDDITHFQDGVSGKYQGQEARIGSEGFVMGRTKRTGSGGAKAGLLEDLPTIDAMSSKVYLSLGESLLAVFVFSDPVKPKAGETVFRLLRAGKRVILVSGDSHETTKALAAKLGIPEAFGGLFPADKARILHGYQGRTGAVAMVGDGINDAPALVQADVGIALYSENHLGKEAAQVALMRGDPRQVLDFFALAKRIRKKMHQNLAWAFVYNLLAIPVAAVGLLTPVIAACAMLTSSLSVIGNTLLLLKKGPNPKALGFGKSL